MDEDDEEAHGTRRGSKEPVDESKRADAYDYEINSLTHKGQKMGTSADYDESVAKEGSVVAQMAADGAGEGGMSFRECTNCHVITEEVDESEESKSNHLRQSINTASSPAPSNNIEVL